MTGWEAKEREGTGEGGRGQTSWVRGREQRGEARRGREDGEEVGKGEVMESGSEEEQEGAGPAGEEREEVSGRGETGREQGGGGRTGRRGVRSERGGEGQKCRGRQGERRAREDRPGPGESKGRRGEAWGERAGEGEAEAERAKERLEGGVFMHPLQTGFPHPTGKTRALHAQPSCPWSRADSWPSVQVLRPCTVVSGRTTPSAPPPGVYPSSSINPWFFPVLCLRRGVGGVGGGTWGHQSGEEARDGQCHRPAREGRRQIF